MADANRPGGLREAPELVREAMRAPRAAAAAGIAFSLLASLALALINTLVTGSPSDIGRWLADHAHRDAASVVLALVPIAGIAFLWFIGVIRGHLGEAEDRFFSTVFLGSGLLFIAMLLAAAATMAGAVDYAGADIAVRTSTSSWSEAVLVSREFLETGVRLAAIFTLAATTTVLRARRAPRWLAGIGYACGLVLLVFASVSPLLFYVFPAWVLIVSVYILAVRDPNREGGR